LIPALLPRKPPKEDEDEEGERGLIVHNDEKLKKLQGLWPDERPGNQSYEMVRIIQFDALPSEMVSRLLVRLHPFIQEGVVWSNEVLLLKDSAQILIQADLELNRFGLKFRVMDRSKCNEMFAFLMGTVEIISSNFTKGKTLQQFGRSPHHPDGLIDLEIAASDCSKTPKNRTLICPITNLPIKAENLLVDAGMMEASATNKITKLRYYWEFGLKPDHLVIFEDGAIKNPDLHAKLIKFWRFFGGNENDIRKAMACDNLKSKLEFMKLLDSWDQKQKRTFGLYKNRDWEKRPKVPQKLLFKTDKEYQQQMEIYQNQLNEIQSRKAIWDHFSQQISHFREEFNDGNGIFTLPMLYGINEEEIALKIIEHGFEMAVNGIYFTSDYEHAKQNGNNQVFLITMTVPGNPYPIVGNAVQLDMNKDEIVEKEKGLNQKGFCVQGYQSHYSKVEGKHVDEMVLFNPAQALPLFLVYTN